MKKLKLIIVLFILAIATLFTGCKIGMESWEDFKKREGLVSSVTYYTNGGTFNGVEDNDSKVTWLKENAFAPNLGVETPNITLAYTDMVFLGWYVADLDADGKVQYQDADKKFIKITDTLFDFSTPVAKNTYVTLGAKWTEDVRINFYLASDFSITGTDGTVKTKGDLMSFKTFGDATKLTAINKVNPYKSTDATYLSMYLDEDCTIPVTDDYVFNKPTGDQKAISVYVKYIQGVWTLVSNKAEAKSMLSGLGSTVNYYLLNDINLENENVNVSFNTKCKIEGNGYKISNFNYNYSSSLQNGGKISAFGDLYGSASIKNFTLENVNINFSVRSNARVNVYALFKSVQSTGATFENFAIDGLTLTVSMPTSSTIANIQNIGGNYEQDNWLFGAYETDSEFTAIYSGISVTNSNFVINN